MKKPFRWNKFRTAIKFLLNVETPEKIKADMAEARRKAAKEGGWRESELAFTMAKDDEEIDLVVNHLKGVKK